MEIILWWTSLLCVSCEFGRVCSVNVLQLISFQTAEGLHLVDKPALKTISFDSMNSVKKLGMYQ